MDVYFSRKSLEISHSLGLLYLRIERFKRTEARAELIKRSRSGRLPHQVDFQFIKRGTEDAEHVDNGHLSGLIARNGPWCSDDIAGFGRRDTTSAGPRGETSPQQATPKEGVPRRAAIPDRASQIIPSKAKLQEAVRKQKVISERLLKLDAEAQAAYLAPSQSKADLVPSPSPDAEKFDWRDRKKVTPVCDEGGCGSVWAFATIAAFESSYAILNNVPVDEIDASEQHLLNCSGAGSCSGGWWAFEYLVSHGVTTEQRLPYRAEVQNCEELPGPYRAVAWGYVGDGATSIPSTIDLKKALCDHGPLAVAVRAAPSWLTYQNGVFSENDPGPVNHAVLLVGWDNTKGTKGAWIIKNFWGTDWGQHGYMDIAYDTNSIGYGAAWVKAARTTYKPDFSKVREVIPDARPFEDSAVKADEPKK